MLRLVVYKPLIAILQPRQRLVGIARIRFRVDCAKINRFGCTG
jgi:hypothetical protein